MARYLQYEEQTFQEASNSIDSKQNNVIQPESGDSEYESEDEAIYNSDSDEEDSDEFERPSNASNYAQSTRAVPAPRAKAKATNTRFVPTLVAPQGLHVVQMADDVIVADALKEAYAVFDDDCKGQIATNQHFFINLPFPIGGTREAGTALLGLDDARIPRLSELIHLALRKLSFCGGNKKVL